MGCWLLAALVAGCGPSASAGDAGTDGGGGGLCEFGQVTCDDGSCVDGERCNDFENCPDGSDEIGCADKCGRGQFRCRDGVTCIDTAKLCDQRNDCPDGEDESTCGLTAGAMECGGFMCRENKCLEAKQKCDGVKDCSGGEDESEQNCAAARCATETDMKCGDGSKCIPKEKICDGKPDCAEREDEAPARCGDSSTMPTENDGKGTEGDTSKPESNTGSEAPTKPGNGKDTSGGSACGMITKDGSCEGPGLSVLTFCDNNRLERRDCRREGKVCGRIDMATGFQCLRTENTPAEENMCGTVTESGTCQTSETLTFCAKGKVRVQNCARRGRECRMDADGKAKCLAPLTPTGVDGCGDLTANGRCTSNDKVYEVCEQGVPKAYDCSASSQICSVSGGKAGCNDKPCGGLTYTGECAGETLRYCDSGILREVDCRGKLSMTCGLQNDAIGFNCLPEGGPCGGLDFTGTCVDDTHAAWCENNTLQEADCGAFDLTCGMISTELGFGCIPPTNSCGDIDFLGKCETSANTVMWCAGGSLATHKCADTEMCGFIDNTIGNWCIAKSTPSSPTCVGHCGVATPAPGSTNANECHCDPACEAIGDCCEGPNGYFEVCD